ncbi:TetR/AcrR family transcriptional regulator [Cupriavidus pinatubonensis]|uniref:TetR/AcrR family transcriptional regulator n=1 Tax=Cupriavidus pinatubonensis TaxID=248026 RepID=UPI00361029C1
MNSAQEGAAGPDLALDAAAPEARTEAPPARTGATTKYRRGLETRQRVIELTKSLIAEHGYGEVTLDRISAHAGVAKSSLLWHFGSKEMLLAEAAVSLFQEIEISLGLGDLQDMPVSQRVDDLFARVADYFTRHPETKGIVLSLLFSSNTPQTVREHIRESWAGHVRVMVEALGTADRPLSADMGRVLLALFHGCYCHWYANGGQEDISLYLGPAKEMFRQWFIGAA